jgi:tRNA1Val (adenine37-N6)-methyltransferase
MPADTFHFKAFSVDQSGAAMKVGSDGCVFGAWVGVNDCESILDLGTGNGYLGLMALQRASATCRLIGVEIEPGAAEQTRENYAASKFFTQTQLIPGRFQDQDWSGQKFKKSDLILSNPPFYRGKPRSSVEARNLARHDDSLTMTDILRGATQLLRPGGRLATVWPIDREQEWMGLANGFGFTLTRWTRTRPMKGEEALRVMSELTLDVTSDCKPIQAPETLTLERWKSSDHEPAYRALLTPYFRNWH